MGSYLPATLYWPGIIVLCFFQLVEVVLLTVYIDPEKAFFFIQKGLIVFSIFIKNIMLWV